MKPVHLPRSLTILLFLLLFLVFLTGTALIFKSVPAASAASPTSSLAATLSVTLTPNPEPIPISADTTGIIALGVLLVSIILFGLLWGGRRERP